MQYLELSGGKAGTHIRTPLRHGDNDTASSSPERTFALGSGVGLHIGASHAAGVFRTGGDGGDDDGVAGGGDRDAQAALLEVRIDAALASVGGALGPSALAVQASAGLAWLSVAAATLLPVFSHDLEHRQVADAAT